MTENTRERLILLCFALLIIALPALLISYNTHRLSGLTARDGKTFILTGTMDHGWIEGAIPAVEMFTLDLFNEPPAPIVLDARVGEKINIELASADVLHGFSLKDFGIFIEGGIEPGHPRHISFTADKPGEFVFSCNTICGTKHESMQGILRIRTT